MDFNTYEYVEPEFKEVITTSEYAAQHFHRMGWMWGRLEVMREQQTWGALREQRVEKELREKIAQEIMEVASAHKELELSTAQSNPDTSSKIGSYANGLLDAATIARGLTNTDKAGAFRV
jgi:uncharacterized HAD superfamily protein